MIKQGIKKSICRVKERKIAFLDMPEGKEEVSRHHLEAHDREYGEDDVQAIRGGTDQLPVTRKHTDDPRRHQLAKQEPQRSHSYRPAHRQPGHVRHPGIGAGHHNYNRLSVAYPD